MLLDTVLQSRSENLRQLFGPCRLRPGKSINGSGRKAMVEAEIMADNASALVKACAAVSFVCE